MCPNNLTLFIILILYQTIYTFTSAQNTQIAA
nr:MAG TPA: hypothetical protein [Caudoviricetes sp.]